ncbi:MAG: hypothetical protein IT360_01420 [Gemmatimonadaceae bacterium]|nr:hypothetical protein [Gemmatimonadaceae bacterium]
MRRTLETAVVLTGVLAAARLRASGPLVESLGDADAPRVALQRSGWRVVLSPVLAVLEQMSLLSATAHVAFLATLVLIFVAMRAWRCTSRSGWVPRSELRATLTFAVGVVGLYAGGILLPLPMARLLRMDADEVAVDFHSHTNASHDGRRDFTLASNAAWHGAGGFDVAYITDHVAGPASDPSFVNISIAPKASNASHASYASRVVSLAGSARNEIVRGTPVLLGGAEFVAHGAHLVRLGTSDDSTSVLLLTTPFHDGAVVNLRASTLVVSGVELVDASPRGLQWFADSTHRVKRTAEAFGAGLLASTNSHGWGSTVAAWTLLRLPGWERDEPARLDARIRALIRSDDASRTRIVVRRSIVTEGVAPAMALPLVAWVAMRSLDTHEAIVWLAWIWVPTLAALARRLDRSVVRRRFAGALAGGLPEAAFQSSEAEPVV